MPIGIHIDQWGMWPGGLSDRDIWQLWKSGELMDGNTSSYDETCDIAYVDAMARRRLGHLPRIALHAAGMIKTTDADIQLVFASRHGDVTRTVDLLHGLAANERPSPAAFSLSVHNTTAGILSIARQNHGASTAMAAGEETLLWALLESAMRLHSEPRHPVLLLYVDEPLPPPYPNAEKIREQPHALALLLKPGENLSLGWSENHGDYPSEQPLSVSFMEAFLKHRNTIDWRGERLHIYGDFRD